MSTTAVPHVSIIIPCRNEARFIADCLDSILASGYDQAHLELLVVDGMSDDGTREILDAYAGRHPIVRILNNERRITPVALNLGLAVASGEIVMRMDAHVRYPPEYIPRLVEWLQRSGADNVGGVCRTVPGDETPTARGIALVLAHPFGVGNAHFRIGVREPRWVDTVPFGCYWREVFTRIGMFDEALVRNQDDELNARLIRSGGRILLVPDVVSQYYARRSLRQLARMYYQYGFFKPLVVRKVGGVLTGRQLVPAAFILALGSALVLSTLSAGFAIAGVVLAALYLLAVLACAVALAVKHGARTALAAAAAFPVLHLSYGVGFLRGVPGALRRIPRARDASAIPVSR
ncbi:MAG TPA: glycosyltransferase family 2 protein [Gemmatimonadaceae bacterium]|nr:glycosyltransferase family 2 protein [Gemmatimonadaceae bacterium]